MLDKVGIGIVWSFVAVALLGCDGEPVRVEHKHQVEHRIKFDSVPSVPPPRRSVQPRRPE